MAVLARASITLGKIKDIAQTYRYYMLKSSTASRPSKPTSITTLPPSGWSDTEPTYTEGSTNSLYTVDLTVFSDGSFEYKDVMLSSTYEAAKAAYNKALAAQAAVDGLEVGGRNLARKTKTCGASEWVLTRSTAADGIVTMTPTTSSAYAKYRINYLDYADYKNNTYTLSFDARYIVGSASYTYGDLVVYPGVCLASRIGNTFGSAYDRYKSYSGIHITDEWERYSITFDVPESLTQGKEEALVAGNFLTFQFASSGSKWPIQIRLIKLEKGTKATDWTPAPEDVDEAVQSAQLTADGKNSVFYSSTQPATTGRKENDIWFDTGNGNKMYYFDGTSWTPKEFGSDALAAESVTAEKILAAAITAVKIAAHAITADKLAIGTGGNMFPNYDVFENISDATITYLKDSHVTPSIVSGEAFYGTKCLMLETDSSGTDGYVYLGHSSTSYGCIPVIAGHKYRVSAYMRTETGEASVDLYVVGHTSSDDANRQHTQKTATVGTEWTRVEQTYTASADYPYISVRVDLNKASAKLYVDAIQIEEVPSDDQVAGPFKPASGTIVDGSSLRIGSSIGGWTINDDSLSNAAKNIFLSANGKNFTREEYRVVVNLLALLGGMMIYTTGDAYAPKLAAQFARATDLHIRSSVKLDLDWRTSTLPTGQDLTFTAYGSDVLWRGEDPHYSGRSHPAPEAAFVGNSKQNSYFSFGEDNIFAEVAGESYDVVKGLSSVHVQPNTSYTVEAGVRYMAIFWHNNTVTCRGMYIFNGGATPVMEIKAASAITITLTATAFSYSFTGSNTPSCILRTI